MCVVEIAKKSDALCCSSSNSSPGLPFLSGPHVCSVQISSSFSVQKKNSLLVLLPPKIILVPSFMALSKTFRLFLFHNTVASSFLFSWFTPVMVSVVLD